MKKVFFVFLFLLGSANAFGQSATTVNLSIDEYYWHRLIVSHFFDKSNGINFQVWYKQPTAAKRVRLYYLRKFVDYSKENTNFQLIAGIGMQGTSRKRRSISYQFVVPIDLQYKRKINKEWNFNTRVADTLALSPRNSQGEHTNRVIGDIGFKYRKAGFSYHSEYLAGSIAGLRENFQGAAFTYDVNKKITLGIVPYTDLRQRDKTLHVAFTTTFKF